MAVSITHLLNQVWDEFRRAGIADDLRIIEGVAALLLELLEGKLEGESAQQDLPRVPSAAGLNVELVRGNLRQASDQADGAGRLLDRYVLFRLPEMLAGGRYPTPRHIVRLMATLADTKGKSVADFACGSAGMLVYSEGRSLTGVEISPEWARIARANLRLHNLEGEIREGNALKVIQTGEIFERVLMNPPFGVPIQSDRGKRSETALVSLALDHLMEGGRAALLVPSGLLFTGSQAEFTLRKRLVDEGTLEAIITLPKDALQPYSALTTHLLLIERKPPAEDACTWFLRPVYDGYKGGRGRDLTADPEEPNDLTLVEKAIQAIRQPSPTDGDVPISARPLKADDGRMGLLIWPAPGVTLIGVRYRPKDAVLYVEVELEQSDPKAGQGDRRKIYRLDESTQFRPEEVEPEGVKKRKKKDRQEDKQDDFQDVFQSQAIPWGETVQSRRVGGILLKYEGPREKPQLMGVAIPRTLLIARKYVLQPEDYLRAPEIRPELVRPHDILLQIHERQRELRQRMDRLAGLVAGGRKELPTSPTGKPEVPEILSGMSEEQRKMWEKIGQQVEQSGQGVFALDVITGGNDTNEAEIRLALELFEAMGLIVPVTIRHPESGQWMPFYRLVNEGDHWRGPEGEEI